MKRWLGLFLCSVLLAQPIPPGATGINFEEALKKIVDRTPAVGIQRANVDATRAKNLPAHLSLLPTLTATIGDQKGEQYGYKSETRSLVGDLGVNLFRFGGDLAAMHAATLEEQAAERTLQDTIIRAEDDGVKALLAVIQADLEVQVLQRIVGMRSDSLKISKERYERGLLAQEEVDKVAVDFDNAQADLRDKQVASSTARAALFALLGQDDVRIDWPWTGAWEVQTKALLRVTETELSHRPDWQSAVASREAAARRTQENWAKIWPSLDLNMSYGYYFQSVGYLRPFQGAQWSANLAVTVPLFDRLVNYSNYKQQAAQKEVADLELVKVQRQAKNEWQAARRSLDIALGSAKARDATLAVSRRLYQANLRRFRAGYTDANQLAVDQQRLYNSELLDIQGWGAVHQEFAGLCHSLGYRLAQCLNQD